MVLRVHQPHPLLREWIGCLWYSEGSTVGHQRERALPTGTVEMVFSLRDTPMRIFADDSDAAGYQFRNSVICGPQSGYFVLDSSTDEPVVGVHFRPGGAGQFLGAPLDELTDHHIGLEDIWGSAARNLRQRLLEASSPDAMFAIMESALLARLRRPLLAHPAVVHSLRQLTTMPALARIDDVCGETGYSPKRFIELFRGSVGLTPKLYCRIQRFQAVIARLSRGRDVEWTDVALDGGFYDQSHLNREFRAFAGVTPAAYRPVSEDRPSHVAIDP